MITIRGSFAFCTKEAARYWKGGFKPVCMKHQNNDFYLTLERGETNV
jgi:hypothetical protein